MWSDGKFSCGQNCVITPFANFETSGGCFLKFFSGKKFKWYIYIYRYLFDRVDLVNEVRLQHYRGWGISKSLIPIRVEPVFHPSINYNWESLPNRISRRNESMWFEDKRNYGLKLVKKSGISTSFENRDRSLGENDSWIFLQEDKSERGRGIARIKLYFTRLRN